ncbi:MAG: hypothetical protein IT529_21580 [Burkholderiales bacterium]|nr:hypothetical protein [Burkholderiales bacterium]
MKLRAIVKTSVVSVVDQAWLGAVGFAVGLAFIRHAEKSEYAYYSMLYAAMLLVQAIHNALVLAPMTTLVPGQSRQVQRLFLSATTVVQYRYAIWLAATTTALVAGFGLIVDTTYLRLVDLTAFAVATWAYMAREYYRAMLFIHGKVEDVFQVDFSYGIVYLAGLATAYLMSSVSTGTVLVANGIAGVVSLGWSRRLLGTPSAVSTGESAQVARELWRCGRWSLPSVVVSWVYANAYIYLSATLFGAAVVADLQAGRLLLVPLGMTVLAWSNVMRPRTSEWFDHRNLALIMRVMRFSLIGLVMMCIAYVGCLYLSFPLIRTALMGARYQNVDTHILYWGLYFLASGIRAVGTVCMLSGREGYQPLYYYGWSALLVSILLTFALEPTLGIFSALAALICAEVVLAALIWWLGWPGMVRARSNSEGR